MSWRGFAQRFAGLHDADAPLGGGHWLPRCAVDRALDLGSLLQSSTRGWYNGNY
jgi:hypothetical protein